MYNINNGMQVNRKVQRFNQSNKIQNRNNQLKQANLKIIWVPKHVLYQLC